MMCSGGSRTCRGKFLILFMKHSWLNVTLVEVWTMEMLVFFHAFPFLFRVELPLSPIDALGIELGRALSVLIMRGIGLLPKMEFLKSALSEGNLDRLVLEELGVTDLVMFNFYFLSTRITIQITSSNPLLYQLLSTWLEKNYL